MTDLSTDQDLYRRRLLNVAKALRESPTPPYKFTMDYYSDPQAKGCGTPACAMGHYAARGDLQSEFMLGESAGHLRSLDGQTIFHDSYKIREHFDIDREEAYELFSGRGCDNARSALEAATYIERFVARRWVSPEAASFIAFRAATLTALRENVDGK